MWPQKCIFISFQIDHFGQFCHQIWGVALCVELTEFLDKIFKLQIFGQKFNFFKIWKANMVKNLKRAMTFSFFQIFWFLAANGMKKLHVK